MQRHEDTKIRRFFTSRTFLLIALVLAIITAFSFARAYYQNYKIRKEIEQLESDVQKLEHKKLESMQILKYVVSQNFVEEKARTELNLKKPGEHVVVINNKNTEKNALVKAIDTQVKPLNNPAKWWYYFTTGVNTNEQDKKTY